ncbi:hypothetical protein D039_1330A, partial [Vibrio parahaemolyticus EKP-028]
MRAVRQQFQLRCSLRRQP